MPTRVVRLLENNGELLKEIRNNLMSGKLERNVDKMNEFIRSTEEILAAVAATGMTMPPIQVTPRAPPSYGNKSEQI